MASSRRPLAECASNDGRQSDSRRFGLREHQIRDRPERRKRFAGWRPRQDNRARRHPHAAHVPDQRGVLLIVGLDVDDDRGEIAMLGDPLQGGVAALGPGHRDVVCKTAQRCRGSLREGAVVSEIEEFHAPNGDRGRCLYRRDARAPTGLGVALN